MRVLHVIARMNVGGTARYVGRLVADLDYAESMLATGYVQGSEAEDPVVATLPIARVKSLGRAINPVADIKAYFELKRIVKDFAPDIVHSHTFKAGLIARLIPGSFKRVHTFHGHLFEDQTFGPLQKFGITQAEKFFAQRTDVLISVGERVGLELRQKGVGANKEWRSIAPGVEPLSTTPHVGAFVVGWMARVTSVKNPRLLVEVAKALPEINFVMAGGGDLLEEIKSIAPRNLSILGWSDAATFWSSVSVALSTSDNEGMPIALIEAQLAGLPVIATDVGSNAEVIEDGLTGFVVEKNVAAISGAIKALASDHALCGQMGTAARSRAASLFAPAQMLSAHADLYVGSFRPAT